MPDVRAGQALPKISGDVPGPRSSELRSQLLGLECPAFANRHQRREAHSGETHPFVAFEHGEGCNLFDVDGNRYVDLAAGFGSVVLGHGAIEVTEAIQRQAERLVQGLGDLYPTTTKIQLLSQLAKLHADPHARVLLCQSGADAITAAMKTAALATGRSGFVGFGGSYHGLSYAPLSLCGFQESLRAPFRQQLNPHTTFLPYPRANTSVDELVRDLAQVLAKNETAAVVVEPILGRGGVHVANAEALHAIADTARRAGALLIADEIWTGIGRCGAMLRTREINVAADLVCVGKGLGGGVSIAACIGSEPAMAAWAAHEGVLHTSTHAGAPLACAAALATLRAVTDRRLSERAAMMGERWRKELATMLASLPEVIQVRGRGLMIGVELNSAALGLRVGARMLQRGFVVTSGGRQGEVLVMTPPLIIEEDLTAAASMALAEAIVSG